MGNYTPNPFMTQPTHLPPLVAWLSCLHANTLVLLCSMYMELVIQKWWLSSKM